MRRADEVLALDVATAAARMERHPRGLQRLLQGSFVAHLRIGAGKFVILTADLTARPGDSGLEQLRRAWPGRDTLTIDEVAGALMVSRWTLQRAGFPAHRGRIQRDEAVRWLLNHRQPASWECAA